MTSSSFLVVIVDDHLVKDQRDHPRSSNRSNVDTRASRTSFPMPLPLSLSRELINYRAQILCPEKREPFSFANCYVDSLLRCLILFSRCCSILVVGFGPLAQYFPLLVAERWTLALFVSKERGGDDVEEVVVVGPPKLIPLELVASLDKPNPVYRRCQG